MKKKIFDAIVYLSNKHNDLYLEIEKLMEALLQDTEADLNQLHEELYFFFKLSKYLDDDGKYYLRKLRTHYLKEIYGKLFIYDKE